jgi:hypothetical protein
MFIDCILSPGKIEKNGELSIEQEENAKIEKKPWRIYAIYEHYEHRVFSERG